MKNLFSYFRFHKIQGILDKICYQKNCMDVDGQTDILVSDSCLTDGSIWLLWDSARWSVTINKKM
jgi:hypothetical protein